MGSWIMLCNLFLNSVRKWSWIISRWTTRSRLLLTSLFTVRILKKFLVHGPGMIKFGKNATLGNSSIYNVYKFRKVRACSKCVVFLTKIATVYAWRMLLFLEKALLGDFKTICIYDIVNGTRFRQTEGEISNVLNFR